MSLDLSGLEKLINGLRSANAMLGGVATSPDLTPELAAVVGKAQQVMSAVVMFNGAVPQQGTIVDVVTAFDRLRNGGLLTGALADTATEAVVNYAAFVDDYEAGRPAELAPFSCSGKPGALTAQAGDDAGVATRVTRRRKA